MTIPSTLLDIFIITDFAIVLERGQFAAIAQARRPQRRFFAITRFPASAAAPNLIEISTAYGCRQTLLRGTVGRPGQSASRLAKRACGLFESDGEGRTNSSARG